MNSQVRDPALPAGMVTFLFTDIEGSTQLLKTLGDNYALLLSKHREILRHSFSQWNGREVDSRGEEFFVAFARATDALAAAVDAQRALTSYDWPEDVQVKVRMGLHTGRLSSVDLQTVNELFLQTQPAHLQKLHGERLNGEQRSVARAALIRARLNSN